MLPQNSREIGPLHSSHKLRSVWQELVLGGLLGGFYVCCIKLFLSLHNSEFRTLIQNPIYFALLLPVGLLYTGSLRIQRGSDSKTYWLLLGIGLLFTISLITCRILSGESISSNQTWYVTILGIVTSVFAISLDILSKSLSKSLRESSNGTQIH